MGLRAGSAAAAPASAYRRGADDWKLRRAAVRATPLVEVEVSALAPDDESSLDAISSLFFRLLFSVGVWLCGCGFSDCRWFYGQTDRLTDRSPEWVMGSRGGGSAVAFTKIIVSRVQTSPEERSRAMGSFGLGTN